MADAPKPRWDSDHMHTLWCRACGRIWVQPKPSGKCPSCHSDNTQLQASRVNVLPRV